MSHPSELMMKEERTQVHVLNRMLMLLVGTQTLFFMNDHCRSTHSAFLGRNLSSYLIVPVPIDARLPCWTVGKKDGVVRKVSVGRIVDFKAHSFALPAIAAALVADGIDVSCCIYDYGPGEGRLSELIHKHGVGERVRFRGPVDLAAFDELVSESDLFIGMGTAALQAAQLGVPTMLAIVDDERGAA
jgi:glycosyltransferase involved in cell wall biosynthesis